MQPLVTVIIPIYKVEQYLRRCVDSVLQQSYTRLEIILVDDGSPDSCGSICDKYAQANPRIRVIHKTNGGLSSARNAGLDIMTGEYVMFVDSDDYIAPYCVEYLVNLVEKFSVQLAIGNYAQTSSSQYEFGRELLSSDSLEPDSHGQQERGVELLSGRCAIERQFGRNSVQYVSSCAKLYARSLFSQLRFPEGLVHEDEGTTYKTLYACDKVVVSQRVVYAYYYNPESITKHPTKKKYQDMCSMLNEQIEFYKEHGEVALEARVRNRYCILFAAYYLPKGYFEDPKVLVQKAKQMYKGLWRVKQIPLVERLKGWLSTYLCALATHLMKR